MQALARMLHHFQSIPWMTYRVGFTPIAVGDVQLRSDAGWGCTLRRCGRNAAGCCCAEMRILTACSSCAAAAKIRELPGAELPQWEQVALQSGAGWRPFPPNLTHAHLYR